MRDLEFLNYEMFYEDIQVSGTQQQKTDLSAAIRSAFREMDDNIRTYKPKSLAHACCKLMDRTKVHLPSFIFTLNQDMFFERYHSGERITVSSRLTGSSKSI